MSQDAALQGRGIVITGGGGHLGGAMALAIARAGATVIVAGRTEDRLEAVRVHLDNEGDSPGRVVPVVADISTDAGIATALDAAEQKAGRVDGWVNNAYAARGGLLGSMTREDVETTLARGLADVMMATQAAAARMGDGGSIVNVASMYAIVSPQPAAYRAHPSFHNPPAYGAAKAGVIAFTRYAAVHLADRGIRVNAIAPGPFPGGAAAEDEAFVQELARRVPLGRIGRPDELGDAVVFLLAPGSGYVTGQALVIDGGWTAW
jgi:gluconate 5-dehydrogenase